MSSGSTTSVVIVLIVVVVLTAGMIVTLQSRVDNVSQQEAQKMVESFVADVANTGILTKAQYQNFQNQLNAKTGKNCNIELEAQVLDENPGKKTTQANYTKIGENVYVVYKDTQILPQIGIAVGNEKVNSSNDTYTLKTGDIFSCTVTSEDSAAQDLKGSILNYSNAGEQSLSASSSAMCTVNGSK